jgi:hypothetical protein
MNSFGPASAINIFDADGKRIWNKQLDEKYFFNRPFQHGNGVAVIQDQLRRTTEEDFRIAVFDTTLSLASHTFSLKPMQEVGHDTKVFTAIRAGEDR